MHRFLLIAMLVLGFGSKNLAAEFRLLKLNEHFVKWGQPAWHSGAEITYSYVRTERHFPEAVNCKSLVPLDGLLEKSNVARPDLERAIRQAFWKWERAANVTFVFVENPDEADILIGAQGVPRDIAYANVSHGPAAEGGIAEITKSVLCLNPEIQWETNLDGDDQTYDIERVATHEIGHAIGLDHPGPSGALMGYRYTEAVNGLEAGDIDGVRRLYGKPLGQ